MPRSASTPLGMEQRGNVSKVGETIMSSAKTYSHYCCKCEEETLHVPNHEKAARTALKTVKIIVFFVSFGMVYPHIFTEENEITVKCEKCGTQVAIATE